LLTGGDRGADMLACHQHFRGEAADRRQRAGDRKAKRREQDGGDRKSPGLADEQGQNRGADRCTSRRGKRHGPVERERAAMQMPQAPSQHRSLAGIGAVERLGRGVDLIGDACEPRGEDVEQGRDAREQEHRRQCDLDDVNNRAERACGFGGAHSAVAGSGRKARS